MDTAPFDRGRKKRREFFVEISNWVIGAIGFVCGVGADLLRQLGTNWVEHRRIRKAVGREIHDAAIMLNFFLFKTLIDKMQEPQFAPTYFQKPRRLDSVDYYLQAQPTQFLTLPEQSRLRWWNEELATLGKDGERPRTFRAIHMLALLTISPLKQCSTHETRRFVGQILDRPEIIEYRGQYMSRKTATRE
ncbi:MAG: hypothetical protein ABI824_07840 [Acidobacteriota bacterium]